DSKDAAATEAGTVLRMETAFALASKTRVELRDPNAYYHKMTLAALEKRTPGIPWVAFFTAQHAPAIKYVDVGQPEFFKAVDRMITSTPVAEWKVFLRW